LEEVHRDNRPVRLPDGLRWNLLHLFTETSGLRRAGSSRAGVDTWASTTRCSTARTASSPSPSTTATTARRDDERAFGRAARADVRRRRHPDVPINTVFQLLADEGSAALEAAGRSLTPTCWPVAVW
jgi:rhamnulokinase